MSVRDRLIGAWDLIEYSAWPLSDPSAKIYPMTQSATGIIIYTSSGYMSAQIQIPGQPPFASRDMNGGTTSELAEAGRNYFAYTGPFYLDENGGPDGEPLLMHSMRCSNFPNWMGDTQRRVMKLSQEGEERFLTLGPERAVEVLGELRMTRLFWRRLPDNLASKPT